MNIKTHVVQKIERTKSKAQILSSVFARKKVLSFITLSLLLIAIPLTVIQGLSSQDIRQRAAEKDPACVDACKTYYLNPCVNKCNSALAEKNTECSKMNYKYNPVATEIDKQLCYNDASKKFHECLDSTSNTSSCIVQANTCINKCTAAPPSDACSQCTASGKSERACESVCKPADNPTTPKTTIIQYPECSNTCTTIKQTCTDTNCSVATACDTGCSQECFTNSSCSIQSSGTTAENVPGTTPKTGKQCYDNCLASPENSVSYCEGFCKYSDTPAQSACEKAGNVCIKPQAGNGGTNGSAQCANAGYGNSSSASCSGSAAGTLCCVKPSGNTVTPTQDDPTCLMLKPNEGTNNVRSAASATASKIGEIKKGDKVYRTGLQPDKQNDYHTWVHVKINSGLLGWTVLDYLQACNATSAPGAASTPSPAATSPTAGNTSSCIQTTSSVNLRVQPHITSDIQKVLASGVQLSVTGGNVTQDGYTWAPVTEKPAGISGWIATNNNTTTCNASGGTGGSCPPGSVQVGSTSGACAPAPSGTSTTSNGGGGTTKPSTGSSTPGASSPTVSSAPTKQVTCSDNPVLSSSPNQIWKAYCTNKCVTNSDCKSLPGWPTDPGSSQCYQFTNGSYCLQLQYNNIAGLCRDNPTTPPSGLTWKAACGGNECSKNSDCPATPGMDNSNWCYGFDDGARCLSLQVAGSTSTPNTTPSAPAGSSSAAPKSVAVSTNPFVNAWDAITKWFSNVFK